MTSDFRKSHPQTTKEPSCIEAFFFQYGPLLGTAFFFNRKVRFLQKNVVVLQLFGATFFRKVAVFFCTKKCCAIFWRKKISLFPEKCCCSATFGYNIFGVYLGKMSL